MQISVLQWNIWYKEDIRNIAEFLRQNPADIVCLQEMTIGYQGVETNTVKYIADTLGYNYYSQEINLDGESYTMANGIFSKYPITAKETHWINEPTGSGHYDDEYRAYIEVSLQVGDQALTIGTTHMSYTNGFIVSERKRNETDKLIKILSAKEQNFIFTGDLNAAPDSYTMKALSNLLISAGPEPQAKTWTTKPFSYDGFEEDKLNWRLDYIYTTADVKINSSEVLKTSYSDHLPVLAHLVIS